MSLMMMASITTVWIISLYCDWLHNGSGVSMPQDSASRRPCLLTVGSRAAGA